MPTLNLINEATTADHTMPPRCWSRSARFSSLPPNDPACPGWDFEFNRMHAWVRCTNSRIQSRLRHDQEQQRLADALRLRHLLLRWNHRAKLAALRRFALMRLILRRALRKWKHRTDDLRSACGLFGKMQKWRYNAARSEFIHRLHSNMLFLRGVNAIKRGLMRQVIHHWKQVTKLDAFMERRRLRLFAQRLADWRDLVRRRVNARKIIKRCFERRAKRMRRQAWDTWNNFVEWSRNHSATRIRSIFERNRLRNILRYWADYAHGRQRWRQAIASMVEAFRRLLLTQAYTRWQAFPAKKIRGVKREPCGYVKRYYRATMSSKAKGVISAKGSSKTVTQGHASAHKTKIPTKRKGKATSRMAPNYVVKVSPYHKILDKKLDPNSETLSRRLNDAFYVLRKQNEFVNKALPPRPEPASQRKTRNTERDENTMQASFRNVWAEDDVLSKSFHRRQPEAIKKDRSDRDARGQDSTVAPLSYKLATRQAERKRREEAVRLTFWY